MAEKHFFVCDACGAQRKEANHWFVVVPDRRTGTKEWITVYPWPDGSKSINAEHFCGEQCLISRVQQYMAKVKRDAETHTPKA